MSLLIDSLASDLQPHLSVASERRSAVTAAIRPLLEGAATVAFFRVDATRRADAEPGALSEVDTDVIERLVRHGTEAGVPIVGVLSGGTDPRNGIGALAGWGRVASALCAASGQVPIAVVVDGTCVGGVSLLLGLVDLVVMCPGSTAYVCEPSSVERFTGATLDREELGGVGAHTTMSGVVHLDATVVADALEAVADVLDLLPANHLEVPPVVPPSDPVGRRSERAAAVLPSDTRHTYDVRDVIADVLDAGSMIELRPRFAPSLVTVLGRLGGIPVGVVANQPGQLAGALDIEGSQKGAAFVRWCDSMNLALVTFVDTPGFRPGKDQEWRGMIRHGAQLAFAYAQATVPRVCVLLRKAYGGAYIVMDSKTMGNDLAVAWPSAEVAVMGAAGAIEVLHAKALAVIDDPDEREQRRAELIASYESVYLSPRVAAERGYIDAVIDPADTRSVLIRALRALHAKRPRVVNRKHANTPL